MLWLLLLRWPVRGRQAGQRPQASLMGALLSSDRIFGHPSEFPVAGWVVGKPQSDVMRSGWPLASLGLGPGAALGAPPTSQLPDSPPCSCSCSCSGISMAPCHPQDQTCKFLALAFENFQSYPRALQTLLRSHGTVHLAPPQSVPGMPFPPSHSSLRHIPSTHKPQPSATSSRKPSLTPPLQDSSGPPQPTFLGVSSPFHLD